MNIFERKAIKNELTLENLSAQGGPNMVIDALHRIYPGFPVNYDKNELLEVLNKAEITDKELDDLVNTNIRSLEKNDKNLLDYDKKFYDIRERIVKAMSELSEKALAA